MNNKELHELIKLIDSTDLAEFKLKKEDFAITIRSKDFFKGKGQQVVSMMPAAAPSAAMPQQAAPAAPVASETTKETKSNEESAAADSSSNYIEFKSPMVGTFYRKPSPDKDAFVKVGDSIKEGDVVCIIEAMKLFNEVESEISGKIVKVMVDDQTPVEYDQVLFLVDPS